MIFKYSLHFKLKMAVIFFPLSRFYSLDTLCKRILVTGDTEKKKQSQAKNFSLHFISKRIFTLENTTILKKSTMPWMTIGPWGLTLLKAVWKQFSFSWASQVGLHSHGFSANLCSDLTKGSKDVAGDSLDHPNIAWEPPGPQPAISDPDL